MGEKVKEHKEKFSEVKERTSKKRRTENDSKGPTEKEGAKTKEEETGGAAKGGATPSSAPAAVGTKPNTDREEWELDPEFLQAVQEANDERKAEENKDPTGL